MDGIVGQLQEYWRYRELLYFFAWRDVKIRYRQAVLGAAWAVIQPLFTMLIFTLFFGKLAGVPSDGIAYPLFSYCALVPWTYFSVTLNQAGNSLVTSANMISKVYFPRAFLPLSTAVSGLLDFGIATALLGVLMIWYKVTPGWHLLLAPVVVFGLVLFTISVGMFLAALHVRFRDVKYVTPFLVQLWLFVTPVIYSSNMIPERFRPLLALNPLAGIVEGFRACVLPSREFNGQLIALSMGVIILTFFISASYFRKSERNFADII